MEAERVNAFARDVHFVKFNVSIKKPIVKILEIFKIICIVISVSPIWKMTVAKDFSF